MKYHHRETLEAEQWFPDKPVDGVIFPPNAEKVHQLASKFTREDVEKCCREHPDSGILPSSNCLHYLSPGDYIITDEYGGKMVWCQANFEREFEPLA